jgi:hypothetical protein
MHLLTILQGEAANILQSPSLGDIGVYHWDAKEQLQRPSAGGGLLVTTKSHDPAELGSLQEFTSSRQIDGSPGPCPVNQRFHPEGDFVNRVNWNVELHLLMCRDTSLNKTLNQALKLNAVTAAARQSAKLQEVKAGNPMRTWSPVTMRNRTELPTCRHCRVIAHLIRECQQRSGEEEEQSLGNK